MRAGLLLSSLWLCWASQSFALDLSLPTDDTSADGYSLPELGDTASSLLPFPVEKKIGRQIMNEIRLEEPSYLDDPEITAYLQWLGNRLSRASSDPGIALRLFAVKDPTINAFAMFGGYIGVNTGLITAVQNESELAGVLAHETAHVTQRHLARGYEKQKQSMGVGLLAMAAALLAARSNDQVAGAAMSSASAGMAQSALNFTRDFEREADRQGFVTLEKSGFDARAMADFFVRLQRATRQYENNAPAYLRTHPLTSERISDMENRAEDAPYKQVPSSLDFYLVRARLKAFEGTPAEAVDAFQRQIREKRAPNLAAAQYGLAVALERARRYAEGDAAIAAIKALKITHPMIERQAAQLKVDQQQLGEGIALFRAALARNDSAFSRPGEITALTLGLADALIKAHRGKEAIKPLEAAAASDPDNPKLWEKQAEIYAYTGLNARQHQALAEANVRNGRLDAAIEQLDLAQKAPDQDFYLSSEIDARLRQLKRLRDSQKNDPQL
ncbi:MAG: M48 family metalloprotease [Zoogloeaceae bacterium]|jgi:predicted Zn-dependent protease|nr:M48 family metalloprotease [Zoogloeaceae bacterium]